MGRARRGGMEVERGAALFQEGRARPRFRRTVPRQGWPHPGPPHPARALDAAFAGVRASLPASRPSIPGRPERRVRRRLFPGDARQSGRATRLGRDGLSRSRHAQAHEPHHLHQHAGQGVIVRGHAVRRRQGQSRRQASRNSAAARSFSPPAPSIRRRICCAPASARSVISATSAFPSGWHSQASASA